MRTKYIILAIFTFFFPSFLAAENLQISLLFRILKLKKKFRQKKENAGTQDQERKERQERETGVCVKLLSSHGGQSVQLALATSSSPGAHSLWPGIYSCEAPIICHLGTFYFIKIQNFFRPRLPPFIFPLEFLFSFATTGCARGLQMATVSVMISFSRNF
jgi:hypothetical protein